MTKKIQPQSEAAPPMIKRGAFVVARKLFESDIWLKKPATWKIIWIYILGKVNYEDSPGHNAGEGFFNFSRERGDIGIDITEDMIKKCLRFVRDSSMISTERSTRGMTIKVLNYKKYQTINNYASTYPSTSQSTREAREKHSDTERSKEKKEVFAEKKSPALFLESKKEKVAAPKIQKHIEFIDIYLTIKKEYPKTKAKYSIAIKRSLMAARDLSKAYSTEEFIRGVYYCAVEMGKEGMSWTLEGAVVKHMHLNERVVNVLGVPIADKIKQVMAAVERNRESIKH